MKIGSLIQLFKLVTLAIVVAVLAGCAGKPDVQRVKCPACGYEFEVEQ